MKLTEALNETREVLGSHGHTLRNAADVYARNMQAEADRTMQAYYAVRADPERAARQDQSMVTTEGLRMSAELFADAARQAREASEALEQLEDKLTEL